MTTDARLRRGTAQMGIVVGVDELVQGSPRRDEIGARGSIASLLSHHRQSATVSLADDTGRTAPTGSLPGLPSHRLDEILKEAVRVPVL